MIEVDNVKETLKSKGIDLGNECQIVDICNPIIAEKFLSEDMSLSIIMPCKIKLIKMLKKVVPFNF